MTSPWTDGELIDAAKLYARVTALMSVIDSGVITITPTAANTPTSGAVTFSKTFPSIPTVIVSAATSGPGTAVTGVSTTGPSTTGVTVWVTRTNTTATTVSWIAIVPR